MTLPSLLTALALLALGGGAWAQAQASTPVLALNTNLLALGDNITLEGRELRPEAPYKLALTAPDGQVVRMDTQSDASGNLRFSRALDTAGRWSLGLTGPGIDATFWVEVTAPEGSATPGSQLPSTEGSTTPAAPLPDTPPSSNDGAPGGTPGASTPSTEGATPGGTASPSTTPGGAPSTPAPSGPATPPTATPPTATPSAGPAAAPLELSLEGDALVARSGTDERWRLDFPADSGASAGVAQRGDAVYLGHGNSLLVLDATSGVVRQRHALPSQVSDVALDGDAVAVTVRYQDGSEQRLLWAPGGLSATVRFGADPAVFAWLRNEAAVSDPQARLERDPTNPWLYVRVADLAATPDAVAADYRSALEHTHTFYDGAHLARVLLRAGQPDLANEAMDAALRDFYQRGYRAELLTDSTLREAYGFPLRPLEAALDRGDLRTAGFWAPWVYRLSTPAIPATQAALGSYARALRTDGQRDEASLWRGRAREGSGFQLGRTLASAARALGRAGWYGVAALLVAIVALHLTLIAKYWRPQTLMLRQRRESGRSTGPVPRLFAIRYYSLTEKVVLVLLFAATLALAGLASWSGRGAALPDAWRSGTLASVPARDALATLPLQSPVADYARGYGAQVAGARAEAADAYRAAGDLAPALINLGVLEKDDALLQRALDLAGRDAVASFNLGRGSDPSPLHSAYGGDTPLLAVPAETTLAAAMAGTFQSALADAFTNPWRALVDARPTAVPLWLWDALVVLFLAWAALTIVWLVIPRPRLAANAPRTLAYHLLALVLPGSGLADELWGVLLLIPWAIFGIDTVLHYLPSGAPATIPLQTDYAALGILYALSVVSFVVEFVSYRRRMSELRREHPETARAYGMRASSTPEG